MSDFLVSIVMPVYNCEEYLREAVDSVLGQTYSEIELICVDDGSTDNSLAILENYAKRDKRVSVVKQQNCYAGVARNNGMGKASGKYIMFLDSDDIFEKNMLSSLVKIARKHEPDVILFGFNHFVDDVRRRSMMGYPHSFSGMTTPTEHKDDLLQIVQAVPWNKFLKLEFIKKSGVQFQSLKSNNDVFFSKTIVTKAEKIYFLRKRLVNYRIGNSNSLQGGYKLASGNFALSTEGIYQELVDSGLYETYKDTFEKYAIDNTLFVLEKCSERDLFSTVVDISKRSLISMGIDQNSDAVKKHSAGKLIEDILTADNEDVMISYLNYVRSNTVRKNSVEYRIGKKLLGTFRIKNYR